MANPDVTVTITQDSVSVQRAGFGVPLLLSHTASWAGNQVRTYTDLSGVGGDFATSSPEYLAASAMFAQNPSPSKIKIARMDAGDPTIEYRITPVAKNSHTYQVSVKGEGVTAETVEYTSDATATVAEIVAGLVSALNGVTGKNFTASDDTTHVTIDGDAAGEWFSLALEDVTDGKIEQRHADPGVATDLAAIELEDSDWYALYTFFNSNAYALAVAAWVESNGKLYALEVNESDAITTAAGSSDTLDDVATSAYERTFGCYHPEPAEMFGAAWLGKMLPKDPGSATWKFKTLPGVDPVRFTGTQRSNLTDRNANSYETRAGQNITFDGRTADGDYVDVQRGIDWIDDDMSARIFEVLVNADKVPFTDPGVAQIEGAMKATLQQAVARGILAENPEPTTTVPEVEDVSSANKSSRTLPDLKFDGTLAGAVHKANVNGVVSL